MLDITGCGAVTDTAYSCNADSVELDSRKTPMIATGVQSLTQVSGNFRSGDGGASVANLPFELLLATNANANTPSANKISCWLPNAIKLAGQANDLESRTNTSM